MVDERFEWRRFGSVVAGAAEFGLSESSSSSSSSTSVVGGDAGGTEFAGTTPTTVVGITEVDGTLERGRSRRGSDDCGTSVDSVSSSWDSPPDASRGPVLKARGVIKMVRTGSM